MRNTLLGSWYACATMAVVAVGCATGPSKEVHQFRPMPVANVGAHELAPVTPKTASDLLQAADEAFKRANTAQEQGDDEAALRNYKQMLELLVEADLDPKIFYNLRSEFERILDRTTQQARLFDRLEPPEWLGETPDRFPVVGDLEIPFPWPERVQAEIDEILELYPKNYQGGLDRYHLYGAYIRRELAAAGLPKDLVWLAMVESQFHPTVVSPAGAAGLWQFMRETGRRYGLRIDNYVDERYNWQKATHAAIAYLTELNQLFDGNWPLAISSYNMGEYGMGRTVAANGGEKDIWKLIEVSSSMREETRKFYPKLLASMIVAASYDRYGFSFNTQPPEQFIRVPVKGSYSLAALEQASNLSSGTLKRLNPDLTRGVTPPNGDHMMAVPIESETLLMAALEKVPTTRHGSVFATFARGSAEKPGSHVVRRGETLGEIAKKYNVSLDTLMKKNKIRSARNLHVGRRLAIPGGETAVASVDAEKAEKPKQPSTIEPTQVAKITEKAPKERKSTTRTYRVRRGDTLYDIAKREGLSIKDLQAWNSLGSGAKLRVGDSLYLESKTSVEQAAAPSGPSVANKLSEAKIASSGEKMTHVVKAGEYPAVIAKNYGVKVEELLKWNQLSAKSKIDVGDKLIVYGPKEAAAEEPAKAESSTPEPVVAAAVAAPAKPEPDKLTHKVAQGENPSVIAAKHGVRLNDFLAWNNLTSKSVLHIGDAYVIQPSNAASPPQTIGVNADLTSPAAAAAAEKRPGEKTMHVVAAGQNPTSIARRYGVSLKDLFKWNGWTKDPVLQVGDKVTVYKKK